jgi:hypothetical protein
VLIDAGWSLVFALFAAVAVLWVEKGHDLGGGLAITVLTQPRTLVLTMGGPDIADRPSASVGGAGILALLVAFPLLAAASPVNERRRRIPVVAITLAILLVVEIVYLATGEVPRERFRGPTLSYIVSVHLAALGVVVAYIVVSIRSELPGWVRRAFWLLIVVLGLVALFPITDSL